MLIYFLLPLIAVALLCVPFIFTAKKIKNGRSPKGAFIGNLCMRFLPLAKNGRFPI